MFFSTYHKSVVERTEKVVNEIMHRLSVENPVEWASCLERYFLSRKDEEGVMLAQAITKKLLPKKRGRRKKNDPVDGG